MDYGEITYTYNPEPAAADNPLHRLAGGQAGVTRGWIVLTNGKPGPAIAAEAVILSDDEGCGSIIQTGVAGYVTVVDDMA